jgi:integrase
MSLDFEASFLRISAVRKTLKPVDIPILGALWDELLLARKDRGDSLFVFPHLARRYQLNPGDLKDRLDKVLLKSGFDESENSATSIRIHRAQGLRRATLRGFHSFKTTWITLALVAGIPMEVVRRVTGHADVEVVRTHYFVPHADEIRRDITSKFPKLLVGNQTVQLHIGVSVREQLTAMNAINWQEIRDRLLAAPAT